MAEVRGGKPVKLLVKGEAVLPAVDIKETQLDFGEVYTGVAARIPLTIINTTPVLAGQRPSSPFSSPASTPCCTAGAAAACFPVCVPAFLLWCTAGMKQTKSHAPCKRHTGLQGCASYTRVVCLCTGMSVDLLAYPSFTLDLPKENWSPDEYEDCPLVKLGRRGSAGSSRSSRRAK